MKILVSDPLSEEGIKILKDRGFTVDVKTKLSKDELKKAVADYDALLVRSGTKVTAEIIQECKKMKVIGRAGVGVDNVDVEAATRQGIVVMNTPGGNTISTAEHTFSMLLSLARSIPQANASLKSGAWDRKKFLGTELFGKHIGIIGLGRIGLEVAKRAYAFGMKIIAYDPFLSTKKAQQYDIELVEMDELLKRADFITVHTPLSDATKHMLGEKEFNKMKKGVKILNCARGGIVDEQALYEAIQKGIVSGCALDVFEQEPPKNSAFIGMDNAIVTPHLGASTEEAQVNVALEIACQVADVLEGKGIRNAVNFPCVEGEVCKAIDPYIRLAEKLGRLQAQIISGHINKVSIKYGGEVVNYEVAPITLALVKGLLHHILGESVNYVNAPFIAKERGITVSETKVLETEQFANLVSVEVETNKEKTFVAGTLFTRNNPRIVIINGFYIDSIPEGNMIITHNIDRTGIVGHIGTILGNNNINIAAMNFGRIERGGESLIVLNVDNEVPQKVLEEIKKSKDILDVKLIKL
ncbi:MAG: phosphoglycerate dehydrogenase [Candidatus Omnitrophica bacterium]|nr:phosphoglycerate dehydrogenase [Candidatus Omnitrophota bacterium]MBU1925421.1 phosphoglycerate dehydrogenase [Candidatus Omnitrophota bacterium]MBU2062763.1 phosphoglycerate dehydrogenase [Candidatus Omnitrophota bacterium]